METKTRRCCVCGDELPPTARPNATACSDECRRVRNRLANERFRRRRGILEKGTPEHSAAASEWNRAVWKRGGPNFKPRVCRGCLRTFAPACGPQRYCSIECKRDSRQGHHLPAWKYREMLEEQGGVCALCGAAGKGWQRGRRELHVDHCHHTGAIRGLLCGDCNTALGRFGDDPARLRAAIEYLERPGWMPPR